MKSKYIYSDKNKKNFEKRLKLLDKYFKGGKIFLRKEILFKFNKYKTFKISLN